MSNEMRRWLHQFVHEPAFVNRYRYYAAILARLDPVEDPFIHVMAVSAHGSRFYLHVNIDFFVKQPQYLKGVLLHEVHHVVLGHLNNPRLRDVAYSDLMELAMEISANEFIREPLPGRPPLWTDYTMFGIQSGQSTLERYELLVQARTSGRAIALGQCVDEHLLRGVGFPGRGNAPPDPSSYTRVRRLIEEAVAEADQLAGNQGGAGGLLAGRQPGRLLEELTGTEEEPRRFMDWRAALQMFVALLRAPVHTYHRPSRRFPEQVGRIPGRSYFPGQRKPPPLLVAIDTSGSMSSDELTEIARQLRPLSDLVDITVVECDTLIHRIYPFQGKIEEVAGRGGTDLRPVFAPDFLREHRPEGIIYFTDGLGPYPPEDPGVRTLWVLSKPHEFGCPWGEKAFLPRVWEEAGRGRRSGSAGT